MEIIPQNEGEIREAKAQVLGEGCRATEFVNTWQTDEAILDFNFLYHTYDHLKGLSRYCPVGLLHIQNKT